ncbi:MAG: hypothetical protein Q4C64_04145 [Erysipelotrichia bacterium]|nr:hypothetical protein [Erysipelotrichia bacterium]
MDKEKFVNDILIKDTDELFDDIQELQRELLDYDAEYYRREQEEKHKLAIRGVVSGVITVLGTVIFLKFLRPYRKVYVLVEPNRKA